MTLVGLHCNVRAVVRRRPTARFRSFVAFLAAAVSTVACGTDERSPVAADAAAPDAASDAAEAGHDGGDAAPDAVVDTRPFYGTPCRSDEHCSPGLRCLASTGDDMAPGLGGPPGGLCTKSCGSPDECWDGANDATCSTPFQGGPRFCLPTCTIGVGGRSKCLGRYELGCYATPESATGGMCIPTCGTDADCDGRRCDLNSGLCVDAAPTGAPLGADCSATRCASGVCNQSVGYAVCSGYCVIGSVGCGFDPASPEPLDAVCLLRFEQRETDHDVGLCAQLCDCDDDCRHPGFVCEPGPPDSSITQAKRGRRGACFFDTGGSHIPCTSTDAGASDAGTDAARP